MKIDFQSLVVFQDNDFLVINKPAHISSTEDRTGDIDLQTLAKRHDPHLFACHRLDKETSGCLLFAKNEEAYRHASIQFEKRTLEKIYHAFSNGIHEFKNEVSTLPILPLKKGMVIIDQAQGKDSKTSFNTLEIYKGHTLIECRPKTGRMHQIRIHLSKKDAPIINDELYGGKPLFLSEIKKKYKLGRDQDEQPLVKRVVLHAYALEFFDMQNKKVEAIAHYPKDLRVLHKQLTANKY